MKISAGAIVTVVGGLLVILSALVTGYGYLVKKREDTRVEILEGELEAMDRKVNRLEKENTELAGRLAATEHTLEALRVEVTGTRAIEELASMVQEYQEAIIRRLDRLIAVHDA